MKRIIIILTFIVICSLLCATDYVAITEIMYDSPLEENPNNELHNEGEFIELYNAHEYDADISGWRIETINPHQIFHIPNGVVIGPQSTLVIAYYDSSNPCEYEVFKDYFCWLYNINKTDDFSFMYQDQLTLPNDTTMLVLKDNTGLTRDSAVFALQFEESPLYAPNEDIEMNEGCLKNVFSVQRRRINFNAYGTAIYNYMDWGGWNIAYKAKEITNNSIGSITTNFWGCNILPSGDSEGIETTNFIQEITPRVAMSDINADQLLNNPSQATVKRTYFDAMYRPTLTFLLNQTPDQNNLVTLQEYDVYTRPTKEWLPIVTEINHLTKNTFKGNVEQFYSTESRPFVEQSYSTETWDNGVIKNKVVGLQKAGADMNSHKTAFAIRGNNTNEVKLFSVSSDGLLECNGFYQEGMLRVKQTKDEDNIAKVVYTNLSDQIVMEKVDNASTYYVYNDLNQLSYVLPPLVAQQITEGTHKDTVAILKKYAYVYKYDNRGNQTYKRLPGCEPMLMVYDQSNALVMTQTGNQRARGTYWTVYKYDQLRRPIYTAEIKIGETSHADLLDMFNDWLMLEYFSADTQTRPMENTGYSRGFFSSHPTELLTVNYYDNYDFLTWMSDTVKNNMEFAAFEDNISSANANGLLTGTRTYYLTGAEGYIETVYYYDYRGREIQRRSTNHLGGYDVLSTKYDFANNITDTWSSQSTNNGITTTEHYHYTYDHANRPLTTTYTFNNESPIVLQSYHYDELGRVRSRHIHDGIDSVAYNYDIRNQVTQIKSSGYEQKYYYNQMCPIGDGIVGINYNGNISATTWTYGNKINGYMYYYDKSNRLKSTYSIVDGGWGDAVYSEGFTYDAHGNITQLSRWDNYDLMNQLTLSYDGNHLSHVDDSGYGSYEYATKQYHDNNTSGNDFAYDANGNMIYDQDRGIAAIRYNLLNLPDTIQFMNGNQIVHRYDAASNRLTTNYYTRKVTTTVPLGNTLKGTFNTNNYHITREAFHNNCVYTANNRELFGIEFVHNPEGFIRYYGASDHYHFYHVKDLLGNIRETYIHPEAGYKECMERTQYYPSGLPWVEKFSNSEGAHPWKYNSKEFVEMHGLDEYDSKARWYYPAICRTTTMDPLAEKYYPTSPYAWCGNNPIRNVDRNGKWIESAWDAVNVVIGVNSLITNIQEHNIQDAIIDGAGLILDVAAVILPVVPGGVSTAIKTARVADNVSDVVNVTTRTATKHNYRKVLQEATGKVGNGYEAHHTLPQKYRKQFEALDINIDEPGNVVWRKKENHRKQNYQHTKKWDEKFEKDNVISKEEIYDFREKVEMDIFENIGDIPLE